MILLQRRFNSLVSRGNRTHYRLHPLLLKPSFSQLSPKRWEDNEMKSLVELSTTYLLLFCLSSVLLRCPFLSPTTSPIHRWWEVGGLGFRRRFPWLIYLRRDSRRCFSAYLWPLCSVDLLLSSSASSCCPGFWLCSWFSMSSGSFPPFPWPGGPSSATSWRHRLPQERRFLVNFHWAYPHLLVIGLLENQDQT